jgi:diguanylate cyclase (GGDEF)-like protein
MSPLISHYLRIIIGINCLIYALFFFRCSDKDSSAGAFGNAQFWMGLWNICIIVQQYYENTAYFAMWHTITFIVIEFSSYTLFLFSYKYSISLEQRTKKWVYVALVFPVGMIITALVRGPFVFSASSTGKIITVFDYLHTIYCYMLVAFSIILLLITSIFRSQGNKKSYLLITAAVLVFIIHNIILFIRNNFNYKDLPGLYDIVYLFCIFFMVNLTFWAVYLNGKEQLIYYSKRNLFDISDFSFFVFTNNNEYVTANSTARQMMTEYKLPLHQCMLYEDLFPVIDFQPLGIPQDREGKKMYYLSYRKKDLLLLCIRIQICNKFHKPIGYCLSLFNLNSYSFLIKNLENSVYTDSQTGCMNRSSFEINMTAELQKMQGFIILVAAGLDNLALINQRLSHDSGEEYIKTAADILKSVKSELQVYRMESSTFAFITTVSKEEEIQPEIMKILKTIKTCCIQNSKKREIPLRISVGYTVIEKRFANISECYNEALRNMQIDRKSHSTE